MRNYCYLLFIFLMTLIARVSAANPLSLEEYLRHVDSRHEGLQGAKKMQAAAADRAEETGLALAPYVFGNATASSDGRPTMNPSFQGTRTIYDAIGIGVGKNTSFGLSAKFSYTLSYTELENANPAFIPFTKFFDAGPRIELTQNLWRNGFGAETKSQIEAGKAQALATGYAEGFKAKGIMLQAEMAYWRLSLAREAVRVQRSILERAKALSTWASKRVNDDLADKADLLQAEAAHRLRELELQLAQDEEKSAARMFNSMRGVDSEEVLEEIETLEKRDIAGLKVPQKMELREDALAAKEMRRALVAQTQLSRQRFSPSLDLNATASLNDRDPQAGGSLGGSFGTQYPTWSVGLQFKTSLDFDLSARNKAAAEAERESAELVFKRKLFENEREWDDLVKRFERAKTRLTLALEMEEAQNKKLKHERSRHERGRSTTFQVLQFEQDYATAQLARLRVQSELLGIAAQLKTFGSLT